MLRSNSLIGFLAAAALFVGGCGAQPGKTIVSVERLGNPVTQPAPEDGVYKLYTNLGMNPVTTVPLKAGETIGFQKDADGKLEGVAGSQTQTLGASTSGAMWKLQTAK